MFMQVRWIDNWRCFETQFSYMLLICRESYEHVIATPHPLTFLFGWQRWAHLGYMLFVGRRIISELRSAARTVTRKPVVGNKITSRRELASGVAFSVLMAAHYAVFFVVDARHLLIQYRRWRAASAQVQILDKQSLPDTDGNGNIDISIDGALDGSRNV